MATVTVTSTVFDRQPVANVTGDITVSGQYNSGATDLSVADVIFLAKIPHGATVVEICVDHSNGETAMGVDYGLATGGKTGVGALQCASSTTLDSPSMTWPKRTIWTWSGPPSLPVTSCFGAYNLASSRSKSHWQLRMISRARARDKASVAVLTTSFDS